MLIIKGCIGIVRLNAGDLEIDQAHKAHTRLVLLALNHMERWKAAAAAAFCKGEQIIFFIIIIIMTIIIIIIKHS